ncbi:hypothetical protein HDU90_000982 [Geranomyces variabilis]|nr:hypothetical protein HDU90_000982 [Geranomyces variabilis]
MNPRLRLLGFVLHIWVCYSAAALSMIVLRDLAGNDIAPFLANSAQFAQFTPILPTYQVAVEWNYTDIGQNPSIAPTTLQLLWQDGDGRRNFTGAMNVTGMYRSVLTMPVAAPASWPMPLVVTLRITVGGAYPANVTATKTLWLLDQGQNAVVNEPGLYVREYHQFGEPQEEWIPVTRAIWLTSGRVMEIGLGSGLNPAGQYLGALNNRFDRIPFGRLSLCTASGCSSETPSLSWYRTSWQDGRGGTIGYQYTALWTAPPLTAGSDMDAYYFAFNFDNGDFTGVANFRLFVAVQNEYPMPSLGLDWPVLYAGDSTPHLVYPAGSDIYRWYDQPRATWSLFSLDDSGNPVAQASQDLPPGRALGVPSMQLSPAPRAGRWYYLELTVADQKLDSPWFLLNEPPQLRLLLNNASNGSAPALLGSCYNGTGKKVLVSSGGAEVSLSGTGWPCASPISLVLQAGRDWTGPLGSVQSPLWAQLGSGVAPYSLNLPSAAAVATFDYAFDDRPFTIRNLQSCFDAICVGQTVSYNLDPLSSFYPTATPTLSYSFTAAGRNASAYPVPNCSSVFSPQISCPLPIPPTRHPGPYQLVGESSTIRVASEPVFVIGYNASRPPTAIALEPWGTVFKDSAAVVRIAVYGFRNLSRPTLTLREVLPIGIVNVTYDGHWQNTCVGVAPGDPLYSSETHAALCALPLDRKLTCGATLGRKLFPQT